jgi:hypothetical protein
MRAYEIERIDEISFMSKLKNTLSTAGSAAAAIVSDDSLKSLILKKEVVKMIYSMESGIKQFAADHIEDADYITGGTAKGACAKTKDGKLNVYPEGFVEWCSREFNIDESTVLSAAARSLFKKVLVQYGGANKRVPIPFTDQELKDALGNLADVMIKQGYLAFKPDKDLSPATQKRIGAALRNMHADSDEDLEGKKGGENRREGGPVKKQYSNRLKTDMTGWCKKNGVDINKITYDNIVSYYKSLGLPEPEVKEAIAKALTESKKYKNNILKEDGEENQQQGNADAKQNPEGTEKPKKIDPKAALSVEDLIKVTNAVYTKFKDKIDAKIGTDEDEESDNQCSVEDFTKWSESNGTGDKSKDLMVYLSSKLSPAAAAAAFEKANVIDELAQKYKQWTDERKADKDGKFNSWFKKNNITPPKIGNSEDLELFRKLYNDKKITVAQGKPIDLGESIKLERYLDKLLFEGWFTEQILKGHTNVLFEGDLSDDDIARVINTANELNKNGAEPTDAPTGDETSEQETTTVGDVFELELKNGNVEQGEAKEFIQQNPEYKNPKEELSPEEAKELKAKLVKPKENDLKTTKTVRQVDKELLAAKKADVKTIKAVNSQTKHTDPEQELTGNEIEDYVAAVENPDTITGDAIDQDSIKAQAEKLAGEGADEKMLAVAAAVLQSKKRVK